MEKIKTREYIPYTFHMCWTQTKADKVKNIKDATIFYLSEACNSSDATLATQAAGTLSVPMCCVDPITGNTITDTN